MDFPPPKILQLLLASWLGLSLAAPAGDLPAPDDGQLVANEVHAIFEAKCLDCHSSRLARPKGKFGYVLDLQRMADNPDYVIRGQPLKSELYKLVQDDEMPGDDADVPPLTAQEKEVVKHWIEIGAPGGTSPAPEPMVPKPLGTAAPALPESSALEIPLKPAAEVPLTTVDSVKPQKPFIDRFLRWIGQSHPVSTHFPVALMSVAVFAEGLAFFTRDKSWMQTVRFLVVLAALSAIAATGLGWINAAYSSYNKTPGQLLWWHRWLGTGAGAWSLICAALVLMGPCEEGSEQRRRFRGALLAGAALVGIAGFLGSALIYGLDHYAWH